MRCLCVLSAWLLLALPLCRAADTIAVLPLFNLDESKTASLDWIGESVAETIQEALNAGGLLVLSRDNRAEVYHRLSLRSGVVLTKASVLKIGEELDAGHIVFGEMRVEGDSATAPIVKAKTRLVMHVIDLKKLKEGPELVQEGLLENLSQMEARLAWMVLHSLAPEGAPTQDAFLRERTPVRVDAMESYVRGLMSSNDEQKSKLFGQAVRLDPHFSQAYFELGQLLFRKKNYKDAEASLAKVAKSDSHFLEAAFFRGLSKYYQNDFDGAADQFRMVSAEIPLNEVFNNLGAAQSHKNDPAAKDSFNKALSGDERDSDYWFNVGYTLWKLGQFELAAADFRAVLERSPGDGEAKSMLERSQNRDGPHEDELRSNSRERVKTSFEASAYRQLQAELKSKH